ncbi:MAG: divalent-cation tolerance protein CutA [Syntrophobacteraceae bacterium]
MTNAEVLVVFVTVGDEEEAVKMAKTVVEENLAACANLVPRIRSIYRWKGEMYDEQEILLIMKTRTALFNSLQSRVRELHSYETPEIIGFPLTHGMPDYMRWVLESTLWTPGAGV